MFNLFRKHDPAESLRKSYQRLQEEAFRLSRADRQAADAKLAEAEEVMKKLEALERTKH